MRLSTAPKWCLLPRRATSTTSLARDSVGAVPQPAGAQGLSIKIWTVHEHQSTRTPEHQNKGYAGLNLAAVYVKYRSSERVNAGSLISISLIP